MSKESEKKGIEASFKSMDTEEFLDIYFNRPIGYAWALFFKKLKVHPNVVTILSIILGVGALEDVSLYSIIEKPMTSCGCFECICGIEPLSNGVCIANREYAGMTPIGMTFSELASMTGGGVQTPGFMGHGKHFIASKKFMKAEGGVARIVWMPKELKEQVAERLNATAKELYGTGKAGRGVLSVW